MREKLGAVKGVCEALGLCIELYTSVYLNLVPTWHNHGCQYNTCTCLSDSINNKSLFQTFSQMGAAIFFSHRFSCCSRLTEPLKQLKIIYNSYLKFKVKICKQGPSFLNIHKSDTSIASSSNTRAKQAKVETIVKHKLILPISPWDPMAK